MPAKTETNPKGAGRKPGPDKASLNTKVLPATKQWLKAQGDMGQAIDNLVTAKKEALLLK
jgi:hypothetical protein